MQLLCGGWNSMAGAYCCVSRQTCSKCIHFGEVAGRGMDHPLHTFVQHSALAMGKWLHIAASAVLAALWIAVFVLKTEIFALSSSLRAMKSIERVQIGVRFEMLPLLSCQIEFASIYHVHLLFELTHIFTGICQGSSDSLAFFGRVALAGALGWPGPGFECRRRCGTHSSLCLDPPRREARFLLCGSLRIRLLNV
jgi:hypothetical protein